MPGAEGLERFLILGGIFLILFGLLLTFWHRIPYLGRLPGDIFIQREGFSFFFPLATSLILSVILTVLLNLVFRSFR
jgi:hypothetical protein